MLVEALPIEGAYTFVPHKHADARGVFLEWYRLDHLAGVLGYEPRWSQANLSTSKAGVVRGIHVTAVPPGQAKYVTCARGAAFDVIVDLRVGSATFGRWTGVRLDDVERAAVYFGAGLGHALCALSDETVVTYLCTETYVAEREYAVHPLDPAIGIEWPVADPELSDRDAAAATLAELRHSGVLPTYEESIAAFRTKR